MLLVALLLVLFAVGVVAGLLLTLLYVDRSYGLDPEVAAFRARQELGEIERQTVQRLMAVELGAHRARCVRTPGTDIIDGTAADVESTP